MWIYYWTSIKQSAAKKFPNIDMKSHKKKHQKLKYALYVIGLVSMTSFILSVVYETANLSIQVGNNLSLCIFISRVIIYLSLAVGFSYIGFLNIRNLKKYFIYFHVQFKRYLITATVVLALPQLILALLSLIWYFLDSSFDPNLQFLG